jgi:NADPH:quinone reductase-like Zn-dependent oxidoreductase
VGRVAPRRVSYQHCEPGGGREIGFAGRARAFFIVEPNRTQLIELGHLIDKGTLRVVVGSVLPLARAREAFEQGSAGHKRGKIVLQVAAAESAKA